MAGLDDLYAQIPTSEIATKLGADEGEVNSAVHALVPVLLNGLQHNSQDPEHADKIESAEVTMNASQLIPLNETTAPSILKLLDALEEHDDVQSVYSNMDVPADVMERISERV